MTRRFFLPVGILLAGCSSPPSRPTMPPGPIDIHSHANPAEVRVTHASLDLVLDFDLRQVRGSATLDLSRAVPDAPLVLDTRDLFIAAVEGADGSPRRFELAEPDAIVGAALAVALDPVDDRVTVHYRTHPGAAALQWLDPQQTDAGRAAFLYTQGQAILTRSWIPLQDSPGVRITYDARVRAPDGLTVVMAAEQLGQDPDGAHRFRMPQPVPSYLVALACGVLEFRPLSANVGVWAEPTLLPRAADEFADVPAMLAACERLFGAYRWGRFDVLVLPPAFPFGGMENPRLTFATPTILAGDRSLVALIAHELAHSWSGNLVTNATWRDFWLNEGFTVYLEQRIMEELYGRGRAEMEILLGMQGLDEELAELPAADQVLHLDLRGRDPDDGMTAVAYDKGAALLRLLERRVGRVDFDAFLQRYFADHAFQSITTAEFEAYLARTLLADHPVEAATVDLRTWIHAPGLPADAPRPRSAAFAAVDQLARSFRDGSTEPALRAAADWLPLEWLRFLQGLGDEPVPADALTALDTRYRLTETGNCEILAAWLEVGVRSRYPPALDAVEPFLLRIGRRKFLTPLYRALITADAGRARAVYARARPRYHAIARRTLDAIVYTGAPPD